jgi:hypothetical protein
VPAQERAGRDEEGAPALPREGAARRGEKDAIDGVEFGASMLTPKDRQLVAQNDDLELLELL